MRTGKAYRYVDRRGATKIDRIIEVTPIRPRGWMIFYDNIPAYEGMVFSKKNAYARIQAIMDTVLGLQRVFNKEVVDIKEMSYEVYSRTPPPEAILPSDDFVDDDSDEAPSTLKSKQKRDVEPPMQVINTGLNEEGS